MERVKTSVRINKTLYEVITLLARNNHIPIQDMIEELLKIGYLKYMEGSTNE
jgi:hypothetical protein